MEKKEMMLTFAIKYKNSGKYSQFGEAGIIDEILRRCKITTGTAVEFGGADGYYCSNTRHLIERGWQGRMYDINASGDVIKAEITTENVNEIVGKCGVLSIDCDNPDYNIWKAYNGKPGLVIIEVNSSLLPPWEEVPGYRGASYYSMVKLGIEKGYFIVAHTGNCIFLLDKFRPLFPEIVGDGLENWELYFDKSHL